MSTESTPLHIKYAQLTDVGRNRSINQDAIHITSTENGLLFILCDGMGGHAGGELAAKLGIEYISEYISKKNAKSKKALVNNAFRVANHHIYEERTNCPEVKNMGTTCVLALISDEKLYFAHVGDSRLYHYKNKRLCQLTRDHSYVQSLYEEGIISWEETLTHPRKNEITRSLGMEIVSAEHCKKEIALEKGDKFLLCSDGLTNMVDNKIIQMILESELSTEKKVKELIDNANDNGGIDNISVQLIEL